jgi:hypothetical protein
MDFFQVVFDWSIISEGQFYFTSGIQANAW